MTEEEQQRLAPFENETTNYQTTHGAETSQKHHNSSLFRKLSVFCLIAVHLLIGIVLISALTTSSLHSDSTDTSQLPSTPVVLSAFNESFPGSTFFAVNLLSCLAPLSTDPEAFHNLIFSPLSIDMALAMAYQGAAGTTATEMEAALQFSREKTPSLISNLLRTFSPAGTQDVEIALSNKIFVDQHFTLEQSYLESMNRIYQSLVQQLDFQAQPEQSRIIINDWVATQTKQKIQDLLQSGTISKATRVVLVNALYFLAPFRHPFDPDLTHVDRFHKIDGSTVDAQFMRFAGGDRELSYSIVSDAAKGLSFVAVDLPYLGSPETALLIVVPSSSSLAAFSALRSSLTIDSLRQLILSPDHVGSVDLTLPRFEIQGSSQSLTEHLIALGMKSAFDPITANFSSMVPPEIHERLFISDVVHKAFIKTAENGTEAAAATGVIVAGSAGTPKPVDLSLIVDHAFLAVIHHQDGNILFISQITNPAITADC